MPAQVIIKLIADPTGLQPGVDALEKLQQIDKSTADEFRAANKAFADRGKVIDQSVTSTEKFANATKKLTESVVGGGITQATQNIAKLDAEIKTSNADTIAFTKTVELAKQKLSTLREGTAEFDKLSKEITAAELAMGNFSKEATSSRGKLKQYRETLLQLEDAGLDGTQVFNDLAEAAGELTDQVGDTQARVRALASDTFKFDVAIQAVQGVAGAFSIAQGAAALFGTENEDLTKALLKVNAAMSILSGLQAIQNILQSESALSIAASIALQRVQVLQTDIQTAAESRFIVVRYAAVAAQRILNFVMAANPAGVILFAIAALGTALFALTRDTDHASEAQKRFNEGLQQGIDITNDLIKGIQEAGTAREAALKAQNATESQLGAVRIANLQSQLAQQKISYDRANANYAKVNEQFIKLGKDASKEDAENRQKAYDLANDAASKFFDIQNQIELEGINQTRTLQDEALKNASAFAQARVAQTKKDSIAETQAQKAAIQVRLQEQLNAEGLLEGERAALIAEANRQIQDLTIKGQQQLLDKQIDLAKSNALTQRDAFRKLEAESAVLELQAQKDRLGKNKEDAILIETQKNEAIRSLRQSLFKDLENIEVTEFGRSKTRQQEFNKDVLKEQVLSSAQQAQARLLANQQKAQDEIASAEAEIARAKAVREQIRDTSLMVASSIAGSLNEIAKNQSDYELSLLQDRLDKGLISQEQYDKKVKEIKTKQAQQDKALALFQATISTIAAVAKALPNIPLSILAGILGAAQIAAIASKRIPEFKKGTKNKPFDGPGLIGEAGPELYQVNGKWGYAAGPMIIDMPKGSKVIPTLETTKIMQRYDLTMPSIRQDVSHHNKSNSIDYIKLGGVIGNEISKIPLQIFGYDKNGPWQHTTTVQNRLNYLKGRYGAK